MLNMTSIVNIRSFQKYRIKYGVKEHSRNPSGSSLPTRAKVGYDNDRRCDRDDYGLRSTPGSFGIGAEHNMPELAAADAGVPLLNEEFEMRCQARATERVDAAPQYRCVW